MSITEENQLIAQRRAKLDSIRATHNPYPNHFKPSCSIEQLLSYRDREADYFESHAIEATIAGRMLMRRTMGKISFCKLQDETGEIQLLVQSDGIGADSYQAFSTFDIGDILGATGTLCKTKTGELSLRLCACQLLVKSLRPLPEKWHGLKDVELRYRRRYLDLMLNDTSREVFRSRSKLIRYLRNFFDERDYQEIESPMLQHVPSGALARPFSTHHNALDADMYLRVAQELALKRCLVGGMGKVYEMNRVFRNEGLSVRHNPEFTMLEYNANYCDYRDYMDLTEELISGAVAMLHGEARQMTFADQTLDFSQPFARISLLDAIAQHTSASAADLGTEAGVRQLLGQHGLEAGARTLGELQFLLFDELVEKNLHTPTFITHYPSDVSPLARPFDDDPHFCERFELFIGGLEIANGFSELNDAELQKKYFIAQAAKKEAGDKESMHYDEDYLQALEYGLPPNAGGGIGVDRLVMLLTNSSSIRDVILFPCMRLEK